MFEVRLVSPDEVLPVRQQVLWPELPLRDVCLAEDDKGLHFGASRSGSCESNDKIVGVASFFLDQESARLRKMAILPEAQRQGCGTQIIHSAIEHLISNGIISLWCDVRVSAAGFYNGIGFEIVDDVFFKNDVAYMKAQRSLT